MKKTHLSLYYLAGYLLPSGLLLLLFPQLALKLLFSNGDYGEVLPRLLGGVLLALGIIVVQIIRLRLEIMYTTTLIARAVLLACFVGLYLYSRDPLFLLLLAVVGLGVALTTTSYILDRRGKSAPSM